MSTKRMTASKISSRQPATSSIGSLEYAEVHEQRMALIRSYNMWYAIGCVIAFGSFWLMLNLSLTIASRPMMIASAFVGSAIIWFTYRAVLSIDREVVCLYPRIVYLEIVLGYDFYRDYLRRRPRGNSERSFVEKSEQLSTDNPDQLWDQIYSHFNHKDFPGSRRVSSHFRVATYLSIILFWLTIGLILVPQYFPWGT